MPLSHFFFSFSLSLKIRFKREARSRSVFFSFLKIYKMGYPTIFLTPIVKSTIYSQKHAKSYEIQAKEIAPLNE